METATQKESKAKKAYDPGKPGEIIPHGNGLFTVESFRNSGEYYTVDTEHHTCSCPHFCYRIAPALEAGENPDPCKHQKAVDAFAASPDPLPSPAPSDDEGDFTRLSDLLPEAAKRLLRPSPDPVHAAQLEEGWADDPFGAYA